MEIPSSTQTNLIFINDLDLRDILFKRLKELDKVVLVRANFSTLILAISSLEGIFQHLGKIFKKEISQSKHYPVLNEKGKAIAFDKLNFDHLYPFMKKLLDLPDIPDFEKVYQLFRNYRNFIHPNRERKELWPINLGQAQMATGLLNASIEQLSKFIFIQNHIFNVIAGNPDYNDSQVLNLKLAQRPIHSFIILKQKINKKIEIQFDLEMDPHNSIFNFVFNYHNLGKFKMLRLDNRPGPNQNNSLLYCNQTYYWREHAFADEEKPPNKIMNLTITIDPQQKIFDFKLDSKKLSFIKDEKPINLYNEFSKGLQIGFFNEVGPVTLSNIKLSY